MLRALMIAVLSVSVAAPAVAKVLELERDKAGRIKRRIEVHPARSTRAGRVSELIHLKTLGSGGSEETVSEWADRIPAALTVSRKAKDGWTTWRYFDPAPSSAPARPAAQPDPKVYARHIEEARFRRREVSSWEGGKLVVEVQARLPDGSWKPVTRRTEAPKGSHD